MASVPLTIVVPVPDRLARLLHRRAARFDAMWEATRLISGRGVADDPIWGRAPQAPGSTMLTCDDEFRRSLLGADARTGTGNLPLQDCRDGVPPPSSGLHSCRSAPWRRARTVLDAPGRGTLATTPAPPEDQHGRKELSNLALQAPGSVTPRDSRAEACPGQH
jgi:hypothetical protein